MGLGESIGWVLIYLFIVIAFYTDIRTKKIPNWLTVSGFVIGLLYHLIFSGSQGVIWSLAGAVVGFVIMLLLYVIKAVGAGDVKLFAAIGAMQGIEFTLYTMMYSVIYAGVIGLLILLFQKKFMQGIKNVLFRLSNLLLFRSIKSALHVDKEKTMRFPFMLAVLPGIITTTYYYFFGS